MLPYRIRPEAEADLNETYCWYECQREGLGAGFMLCFEEVTVHTPGSLKNRDFRESWDSRTPKGETNRTKLGSGRNTKIGKPQKPRVLALPYFPTTGMPDP